MKLIGGLDELAHRRALKRWRRIGDQAEGLDLFSLAALRQQALGVRAELDRVIDHADRRLSAPVTGASDPAGPREADCVWRPDVFADRHTPACLVDVPNGALFGSGLKLFHDAGRAEITLRQRPGRGRPGAAPQGLELDALGFDGSFLSLVIDLPELVVRGLSLSHIVQVDLRHETEREMKMFARLNVLHGPNTEQIAREFDMRRGASGVEFDLAYTSINEARVERAWLDLIVNRPAMSWIALRDLVVSRRLRAEM